MIKPQTIAEQMLFNTIRIETSTGSGTGFFFQFKANRLNVPIIVSNQHVVNNNQTETTRFSLHTAKNKQPEGNIDIEFKAHWFFHEKYDLCFCFALPLFDEIKTKESKEVYCIPITEEFVWDNAKLLELSVLEDVVMVGYPNGLWDEANNLPLFRKGVTSSHPAVDFNNEGIGVVDMACFPGSSGSPIFILNENGYSDKAGNTYMGTPRIVFLGILFSGPLINSKGEIVLEDIPTQQKVSICTPSMINLGYYIKASAILDFKPMVDKISMQVS
jgi:hypothetical protein